MDRKTYDKAAAMHDLKIDQLRDAWLRGFSFEQRVRLNLQSHLQVVNITQESEYEIPSDNRSRTAQYSR